jgi:type VI secretion system protein ImpG
MSFNDYFQDEMDYLVELGAEFVKENAKLEPFLNPSDPDPDVRRLLEGFAFLTGRLRQKLDDEFPELTHSLMRVLWPHYLRPIPCMSVLELSPIPGAVTERQRIAKGRRVEGRPLGDPPIQCQFRTCYDVDILPIKLDGVEYRNVGSGGVLDLTIAPLAGVSLDKAGLERLRLYLHADRDSAVGSVLYLWLRRYLAEIEIKAISVDGETQAFRLPSERIQPVGLDGDSALLPYPDNAFSGYRLLQEYFALPEKFHFVDLEGLEFLAEVPWVDRLQISFRFSRPIDDYVRVRPEHVRLHCTPIANLFPHEGDPIRLEHRQNEYRVRPHSRAPRFFEVFSVDRVFGAIQGSGRTHRFTEFESFQHEHEWDEEMAGYYRLRLAPTVVGRGVETYISFVTEAGTVGVPPMETVSLELTCTNRNLPELLRVGEIDQHSDDSPEFTKFRNIAKVSPSLAPPLDSRLHWRLVSNMALNYMSLLNVDALREILATYDFRTYVDEQAKRASEARLKGIERVNVEPMIRLKRGLPVRGLRTTMSLRERSFGGQGLAGEAGMFMFGTVLSEFLGLYASVNSFHELHVLGTERKEIYQWPRRDGLLPLL